MVTRRLFPTVEFYTLNTWINYLNAFECHIIRTSQYPSTDIDQIILTLSPGLSINPSFPPTLSNLNGINPPTIGISYSGENITLDSISELAHEFNFTVHNVLNPISTSTPINIQFSAENSLGYVGEYGSGIPTYPTCDYPCKTCTTGITNNCTSCYSENHSIFEGGLSKYQQYISGSTSTCLNECPGHTYSASLFICSECSPVCAECYGESTNCTKCFPSTFLYNNNCISTPCPAGYSNNIDEWRCQEIRGFEVGTIFQVHDMYEVEKIVTYKLILKPEVELKSTGGELRITHPLSINIGTVCYSTPGTCTLLNSLIYINNFLTVDYVTGDYPIEVEIYDTYTNPPVTYLFSEMEFVVESMINATIYHRGNVSVVSDNGNLRYTPHELEGSISTNNHHTMQYPTLTFTLTNKGFPIPKSYKIYILIPISMRVIPPSPTPTPVYTVIDGLNAISSLKHLNSSLLEIDDGFSEGELSADSMIIFSIGSLHNSYTLGVTGSFHIYIFPPFGSMDESQFMKNTGLGVQVTHLTQFASMSVIPGSYITSGVSVAYEFTFTLGVGGLVAGRLIIFKVPDALLLCDSSTITGTDAGSYLDSITMKAYNSTSNRYSFEISNSFIPSHTILKYTIECQNPESTRPTGDFLLQAATNSGDPIYESIGSSISMTTLNTFLLLDLSMINGQPLTNNTLTININKTQSTYPSTDINRINITVPNSMNVSACSLNIGSGIGHTGTITLTKTGQILTIRGITQLQPTFNFQLINIQNPPNSLDNIELLILTFNTDGYQSESGFTNILHILCDFPCKTCETAAPLQCLTCFPQNAAVFGVLVNQPYLYVPAPIQECVVICPSHYYINSPDTCGICNSNCLECNLTSTTCTACYNDTYLHEAYCMFPPCPPHYYQNDLDWLCQRIYIYIYIQLACHESCANCSSTLSTGCTLCYPKDLHFRNSSCGKCPTQTFFNSTLWIVKVFTNIYIYK